MGAARIGKALIAVAALAMVWLGVSINQRPSHNDVDASFAASMIPHHELGVRMAEAAVAKADNVRVRRIAFKMVSYQKAELERLAAFSKAWGGEPSPHIHGMLTPDEEAALDTRSGNDYDRAWLAEMIVHHEGAIEMCNEVMAAGQHNGARAIAKTIVQVQSEQIAEMVDLVELVG